MQLRVRNGKGAKGRVLPLSELLLQELENYWRAQRQGKAGSASRFAESKKSIVAPSEFTARYKYTYLPLTRTYVSSTR
jgi:hypothetical protein